MLWKTNPELFCSLMIAFMAFIIECFVICWWEDRKEARKAARRVKRIAATREQQPVKTTVRKAS